MLNKALVMFLGLLIYGSVANATTVGEVKNYLSANLEGKTLKSPEQEFVIEAGKLIGVSSFERTIEKVESHDRSVKFLVKVKKVQTNYRLDQNGGRVLPGDIQNKETHLSCIFSERRSLPKVLGICHVEEEGAWEYTGEAIVEGEDLVLSLRSLLTDGYTASTASGWKPVYITHEFKYRVNAGVPSLSTIEAGYDYNVETGVTAATPYASISRDFSYQP